jgi:nucleoid DNA-binding protein
MTDKKINLQHLTTILSEKSGLAKKDTEKFLREWFEVMGEAIIEEGMLKVKRLGTFKLTSIEERESVNVVSGERILIPAHNKIIFTPDKNLSELVNEPFSWFETVEIESEEQPLKESLAPEIVESIEIVESTEVVESIEVVESTEIIETAPIEETAPVTVSEPVRRRRKRKRKSKLIKSYWVLFAVIFVLACCVSFFYNDFSYRKRPAVTQTTKVIDPASVPVSKPKPEVVPESIVEPAQDTLSVEKPRLETPVEKYRTVVSGERLTLIAKEEYGNKFFWVYIYEENKNILKNPDRIIPGLKLVIPPAQKYGIDKNDEKSVNKAKSISDAFKK